MDDNLEAARCQLRHGDPALPAAVKAARDGERDLIARTWRAGERMSRDERRLLSRYARTIDEHKAATIAAWRACPRCSGSTD